MTLSTADITKRQRLFLSVAALIRAANLDHMEPRMVTRGSFTWDENVTDVVVSYDGLSATATRRRF